MYMSLLEAVLSVVVCKYCYGWGGGGGVESNSAGIFHRGINILRGLRLSSFWLP
jgi:hypothetical protein